MQSTPATPQPSGSNTATHSSNPVKSHQSRQKPLHLSHLSLESEIGSLGAFSSSGATPIKVSSSPHQQHTPMSQYTKTLFTATPMSASSGNALPSRSLFGHDSSMASNHIVNIHASQASSKHDLHQHNLAVLFPHPTPYYQKKIIFACNNASNRELTQLVLRLGRLHKNGYISRYYADILLRMVVEGHTNKQIIEEKIFGWPEGVREDLIGKEDLRVVYDARVDRLVGEVVTETTKSGTEGASSTPNDEQKR
uniref:Uncharacterized protein n=1 Tax=Percolomonas cosmopolitus TaxID=63605 RepID=A0A7S1PJ60_9EUKA|mmetsp:Transcript_9659/g.35837  ORF Transcript_9659/g.35837 Transcript_9659/m.35837 type:complete len:252 (+) Transcript_9659:196-951(+)|eukprot:CAMPEP_0117444892 /NCGR_PEP_ID=MMETSP0759-20121206/5496_1 /TAXON_ID=63605 /ORGANISM="Percolomonas cosmopolitus, Strain WS" /LENGTH=251 /DNA_ID=CAMNT_0005237015 /DNA_START=193 /DNA_END=948 /DNA_ORIENTATION=-